MVERDKEGNFIFYKTCGKTFFSFREAKNFKDKYVLSGWIPIYKYIYSRFGDPNSLIRKEEIY